MGIGGISIWQLLIILAILIMIFGTKSCVVWAATSAVRLRASRKP